MTDPNPPPPISGTHEEFVELFDEYLGAFYPPAGPNRTDTGRRKLTASIAHELRLRRAGKVLDCAAGTGFPSLDLTKEAPGEFELHCGDGDQTMVTMLAKRAADRDIDVAALIPRRSTIAPGGADLNALVVPWADLDQLGRNYDYVLCRGNALAYADTWTGDDHVATEETIHDYLERMARRVRPGGHLHVDAPKTAELKPTIHRVLGTKKRSIVEDVAIEEDRRRWTVTFRHGEEQPIEFTRFSSKLIIDDLTAILDDIGFEETEPVALKDERPNYGVIIARKPD